MPSALGSSSRYPGLLCLLLCFSSSIPGCAGQPKEERVAWLVPEGGAQAAVPAGAATFARAEDFLTPPNLAVYDTLLMAADYSITAEAWGQQRYDLKRNLTIASPPGYVFKLEFDFVAQGLRVPKGVTVTLRSIALGKVRDTAGWSLPFFTGDGGTMVLLSVVRTRIACLPVAPNLPATLTATPRPPGLPGRQQVAIMDYYWRGTVYPGSFHSSDLALFLGPGDVDDMQSFKGYDMLQINVTRVCLSYVPSDCVDPPDICLKRAVQQMLYGKPRSGRDLSFQALLAAIVVPVVAAAVILAAVAWLLLLRRRKQQQKQLLLPQHDKQQQQLLLANVTADQQQQQQPPASFQQQQQQQGRATCSSCFSPGRGDVAGGGSGGWGSGPAADRLANICSGASGSIEDVATGAAAGGGGDGSSSLWRLMACHNAPEFRDATPKDKITLGVLLGVGSFGRVYKGRWRGLEVAVKVLHHDSNTAAAVANEMDLVMSFKHPNITTAYHFVTWNYENGAAAAATTGSAHADSGSLGLDGSTAADAALPAGASSSVPELSTHQTSQSVQDDMLHKDFTSEQGSATAAPQAAASSTASASAIALLKSRQRSKLSSASPTTTSAAAAGQVHVVTQPNSTFVELSVVHQHQVVVPIGALGQLEPNGFSTTNGIAAGPPAAAAAAAGAAVAPLAAAVEAEALDSVTAEPAGPPAAAAAAAAAGGSWSSSPDDHHSSISTIGSWQVRPEGITLHPAAAAEAAAAAAAAAPAAVVSASTDSQPVQLWPSSPRGRLPHQPQFVVLTPLQIDHNPDLHLRRQQQQQPLSPRVPAAAADGTGGSRKPAPCEAQTWLVMEYCNGGTLLDVLQEGRLLSEATGKINMAHVLTLLCDVAAGMSYLHSRNVLHGDLKPGNVLLKQQQGAPFGHVCKVTDFGMSRCLGVGQSHRSTRTLGTVNHTSPELLRLGRLSPAGDIYAFGVLMWELYTGRIAWAGLHYGEVFERVALMQHRPAVPPNMPGDYAALMAAAWAPDPFTRPSFESIRHQLAAMLAGLVQAQDEAAERFVCDLV